MAYHAAAGVHAGVRFAIVSRDEQHCRYRQEVTLLGMRQADHLLNTWLPDGSLHSEAAAGTNQGLRVLYRFAGSATLTVAQRALSKAFEKDRRDLESGGYARYRLFELSLHSWDLRVALDPTARLLPDSVPPLWTIGTENVNRRANADAKTAMNGMVWGVAVHGPVEHQFALVVRDGAVQLADAPPSPPVAGLRLPAEAFIRLYTGRLPLEPAAAAGDVAIAGDRAAALRLNTLFPGF